MRYRLFLPVGLVLAGLVGCGPQKAPHTIPVTTTPTRNAPAWIDNEEIPDGLAAVGIAQPNPMGDKGMQRTIALADARNKLAGKLKVRVQNMFSQLNQQVTNASADASKKPIKTDVMNRIVENVTRQLVDQDLSGTTTRNLWYDPSDNSLYVFVVMTKDTMDRALAGAAQSQIRKEIQQGEQSLDKALDKLDAAIAASESGAH
jgi:signal recognition particle GTPase